MHATLIVTILNIQRMLECKCANNPSYSIGVALLNNHTDIVLRAIYLSTNLDQETMKGPFWSWSRAATCYYQSNHSKVEAIPLSGLLI